MNLVTGDELYAFAYRPLCLWSTEGVRHAPVYCRTRALCMKNALVYYDEEVVLTFDTVPTKERYIVRGFFRTSNELVLCWFFDARGQFTHLELRVQLFSTQKTLPWITLYRVPRTRLVHWVRDRRAKRTLIIHLIGKDIARIVLEF